MRKRLVVLIVAVAAAALSWVVLAPAQSQAQTPPTTCNGVFYGGSVNSVVVPSGSECVLINTTVKGNVTASPNSSLRACGANIKGSVQTNEAYVNMDWYTTVGGSIWLNQTGTEMFEIVPCGGPIGIDDGYAAYICPRNVGGSIHVTNGDSGLEVAIGECGPMNIHGSVWITNNDQSVSLQDSNILGSLTCLNNNPPAEVWDTWVTGPVHGNCFALPG